MNDWVGLLTHGESVLVQSSADPVRTSSVIRPQQHTVPLCDRDGYARHLERLNRGPVGLDHCQCVAVDGELHRDERSRVYEAETVSLVGFQSGVEE